MTSALNDIGKPLEPGLELDRFIAMKILGWIQISDIGGPRKWWLPLSKADEILSRPSYPPMEEALCLNHFSTDISAAWSLVERFRLCVVPAGDHQWSAFRRDGVFQNANKSIADTVKAVADTAPHAICLALMYSDMENKDD